MEKSTKTILCGLSREEVSGFLTALGQPRYRGAQVFAAIHRQRAASFSVMTGLPLALRQQLAEVAEVGVPEVVERLTSGDGTTKLLLKLSDGSTVEAVGMVYLPGRSRRRLTLCLSSQVGCPIGCPFCATGRSGFVRSLQAGEIVGQALALLAAIGQPPAAEDDRKLDELGLNLVFMGMEEPLLNYDQVLKAARIMHDPAGLDISWRRITISTAGIVPGIRRLQEERLPLNLAVSLHAAENRLRDRLVPVNRRYPLEQLIPACRDYAAASGRRLTFEYVLLPGVNDRPEQAHQLGRLLEGMLALVNLIPENPADPQGEHTPRRQREPAPGRSGAAARFARILRQYGIGATVRQGRGSEIAAACGQLRSRSHRTGERERDGGLGKD